MKTFKLIILSGMLFSSIALCGCSNSSQAQVIQTSDAPAAIGPYSQAVVIDKTVYISGQIAIDPKTNQLIDGDISTQTRQVMKNIGAILLASSSSFDNVLKTTIFLTDLNNFSIVNEIYSSYFVEGHYPARSCVEISSLPKGALIEIETVARQN